MSSLPMPSHPYERHAPLSAAQRSAAVALVERRLCRQALLFVTAMVLGFAVLIAVLFSLALLLMAWADSPARLAEVWPALPRFAAMIVGAVALLLAGPAAAYYAAQVERIKHPFG